MKMNKKLISILAAVAVLAVVLSVVFIVGAANQPAVDLTLGSVKNGVATVNVTLTDLSQPVDYVQVELTPTADKGTFVEGSAATAVPNLTVAGSKATDGKLTFLAYPAAQGVAMESGTQVLSYQVAGVGNGDVLSYSVRYILCYTDGSEFENTVSDSVTVTGNVLDSSLEAETDSIYWRYLNNTEAGVTGNAVGGSQPGTDANMQTLAQLQAGEALKKTEHPMVSFIVDVEAAGDYTLNITYRGGMKTGTISDYFMVVGVDDAAFTKTSYVSAHPDNGNYHIAAANVSLSAGRHVIRLVTMTADTRSDTLYANWINIDCMDVEGPGTVTAVAPQWTHLQAGDAEFYKNFTNPGDTSLAAYGDWYASVLGGYQGDSTAANNGVTVDNFTIYELQYLGWFSYTVEVPADGYYDLQTYIRCYSNYDKQRTGHILLGVDGQFDWYPAEYGYSVLKWNAQNLSCYLTKGTHVLTVSGMAGDLGTCSKDWCDMGALSVSGGITLASEQIDPLSLIPKLETVYVSSTGSDMNAGTQDAPVATLNAALRRVAENGTVHIVDSCTGTGSVYAAPGTITVTGGTLDMTGASTVYFNSGITFDDVTVTWAADGTVYANGHPFTVNENVTVNNRITIYGGGNTVEVASTQLTLYAGDYNMIYGGGYLGSVTGTAKLTVGGTVNNGFGESAVLDHDSGIDIVAGAYDGPVGKTELIFGGNALARVIYGAGRGGNGTVSQTNVTFTGGKAMGIYGGGRNGGSAAETNVVMTGGYVEQLMGGNETANLTGNTNVTVTGGEISRRIFGGCYDDYHVIGTTTMILGAGLDYSRSYLFSENITARSRGYNADDETAYLYFTSPEAYDKFIDELASDPCDNLLARPAFAVKGQMICYASLEEAVDAYDPAAEYIRMVGAAAVNATLTKDLYIDLNGFELSGTLTAGEYKIYGMDTTTDEYTCQNMGLFTCVDADGNAVVPERHFKTNLTGAVRRYMAIENDGAYSFHRFYLGATYINLKPATTGLGYKAVFAGDDMVKAQITSYGFKLQLGDGDPVTATKEGSTFESLRTVTLRLENYDLVNYGEETLYGNMIMVLTDGTVIESATYECTMRSIVESVNDSISQYSAEQISAIQQMLEGLDLNWDIADILSYSA